MKCLFRAFAQFKLATCIGILLGCLFGWIAFMASDNLPPYVYDVERSKIIPDPALPGDQVIVMWKIKEINRTCPGVVRRMLFDPETRVMIATYDPSPSSLAEGAKDQYLNISFALPKRMPVGKIGYRAQVWYHCNLYQEYIRPLVINTPELFFEIMGPVNPLAQ